MIYYDIHTHRPPVQPEDVAIINKIVGAPFPAERVGEWEASSFCSYGIHPWYISDVQKQLAELRKQLCKAGVVAIGEAGFDKLAKAPLSLQEEAFIAQARLAEEFRKPLLIHCVKAWDELIAARKTVSPSVPWVIHGFRGNGLLASQLLRQGFLLSFGMQYNEEALRAAWPESLFAETDDQEKNIRIIYARIASSLSVPLADFARQIATNTLSVFSFPSLA